MNLEHLDDGDFDAEWQHVSKGIWKDRGMTPSATDPFPAPDHEYGYTDAFLVSVLGERMNDFRTYMLMKTFALDRDQPVYYPSDVRRFVDYHVTRTARRLTDAEVRAVFDTWTVPQPDADPDADVQS